MEQPIHRLEPAEEQRLSDRAFNGLAAALAFLAYFAVFLLTSREGVMDAAEASLRNMIPLIIVSAAAQAAVSRYLIGRSVVRQVAGHVVMALLYTLVLYWLLMILIGVSQRGSFTEFVVRAFFPTPAITWQLLQGLTLYALVACLTYMRARPPVPSLVVAPATHGGVAGRDQSPSRYFIRKGEGIQPIEIAQIVSIRGADDYAEVATTAERHLVKMTLNEFESTLEGENFIRVHRSHIVNVDRIARAEPAGGGRLLLHMDNGEMIQASRAGSRLLRDRVI